MVRFSRLSNKRLLIIALILLIFLAISTKYLGGIDVHDYADVAKFFAGKYSADIRSSHSMLYGFIHAPFLIIFNSFLVMKITNLLWLALIILSLYYISNKDRRTLLLTITSPIIWYMGPWISPIQLAALFFLWGFFFINKFDRTEKIRYLALSGIFIGLAWATWNTVFFILFFLIISFFYGRNINHLIIFLFFVTVGLLPILIFDQIFFGFFLYSTIRHVIGNLIVFLYGSIYPGVVQILNSWANYISFLLMLPLFSFILFKKDFFVHRKRQVIFLTLTTLFFLINPQVRYLMFLWPIFLLYLPKNLTEKEFKIQLSVFILLSILVTIPYVIQIKFTTNVADFDTEIANFGNWQFSGESRNIIIAEDINNIAKDYSNEVFLVGNDMEDYADLAHIYWGENVKEFVSLQDYNLHLKGENSIFEKRLVFTPRIQDRRQIWIGGGLEKSDNDATDYASIIYGIGVDKPLEADGFELIQKYNLLYLSKKS